MDKDNKEIPITENKNPAPGVKTGKYQAVSSYVYYMFFGAVFIANIVISGLYLKDSAKINSVKSKNELAKIYEKNGLSLKDSQNLKELNKYFITEADLIEFVKEMNKGSSFFENYNFNFDTDEPKLENYYYLSFTIKGSGSFKNINKFIQELFNSPYIRTTETLEISNNKDANIVKKADFVIKGRLYISDNFK